MKGKTTTFDLETGITQEIHVSNRLNEELNLGLKKNPDIYGIDYLSRTGESWEIKMDNWIGISENFMIEILASIYPKELGWFYRYTNLNYLVYTNENEILVFDWQPLQKFLIENIEGATIKLGVKNNAQGIILLYPFNKVKHYIKHRIKKW